VTIPIQVDKLTLINIMKKKILLLLIVVVVVICLCYIKIKTSEKADSVELSNLHKLELREPLLSYSIHGEYLIYANETAIYIYNYKTRKQTEIYKLISGENVAYSKNGYICLWQNFLINSKDEVATKMAVLKLNQDSDYKLVDVERFQSNLTIRPLNCDDSKIDAEDYYPNSLNRKYKVNLKNNEIREVKKFEYTLEPKAASTMISEKTNGIIINHEGDSYTLKYANIFIHASATSSGFLLSDYYGSLWHVEVPEFFD
jgi:hypothetical protein